MKIILEYEPGEDHVWALRAALKSLEDGRPSGGLGGYRFTLMGGEERWYTVKYNKASVSVWRQK